MKLLSVAVPCYNSAEYMENTVNSILKGGERVEIIIVDDGSKDDTLKIGQRLASEHPNIIKCIHQENGGHGCAVNTGITNATGKYFKVVDSDDSLDYDAMVKILDLLQGFEEENNSIDMLISNFLYDKQGVKKKKVMSYKGAVPENKVFGWDEFHLGITQFMLMHSVIYRTEVLRECGLELPKHTFYVDNIYVFHPLPFIKKMYYLDVVFYKYFIGRDDQSVNESVMVKRIDQQYRVTRIMADIYNNIEMPNKNVDKAMVHYFDMMMCVSSILSIIDGSKEKLQEKKKLWNEIKETNPKLYKKVRYSPLGFFMNLPGKFGRWISVIAYKITNKIFGFN